MQVFTVPSRRILPDTVALYNYAGEVNDEATYEISTISHCYCMVAEGADLNDQGRKGHDSAQLYIFDKGTEITSTDGQTKTYLHYKEWDALPPSERSAFWTLHDDGRDYFVKTEEGGRKFKVTKFSHKKAGSKRMWHFEVSAK